MSVDDDDTGAVSTVQPAQNSGAVSTVQAAQKSGADTCVWLGFV